MNKIDEVCDNLSEALHLLEEDLDFNNDFVKEAYIIINDSLNRLESKQSEEELKYANNINNKISRSKLKQNLIKTIQLTHEYEENCLYKDNEIVKHLECIKRDLYYQFGLLQVDEYNDDAVLPHEKE